MVADGRLMDAQLAGQPKGCTSWCAVALDAGLEISSRRK